MNFAEVTQAFRDEARRKIGRSRDRTLDVLDLFGEVVAVACGDGPTTVAALGPSLDSLAFLLADLSTFPATSFGGGTPVAYLFEPISPSLLVIGSEETAENAARAVELIQTWVW